jgi:hypothetical protein
MPRPGARFRSRARMAISREGHPWRGADARDPDGDRDDAVERPASPARRRLTLSSRATHPPTSVAVTRNAYRSLRSRVDVGHTRAAIKPSGCLRQYPRAASVTGLHILCTRPVIRGHLYNREQECTERNQNAAAAVSSAGSRTRTWMSTASGASTGTAAHSDGSKGERVPRTGWRFVRHLNRLLALAFLRPVRKVSLGAEFPTPFGSRSSVPGFLLRCPVRGVRENSEADRQCSASQSRLVGKSEIFNHAPQKRMHPLSRGEAHSVSSGHVRSAEAGTKSGQDLRQFWQRGCRRTARCLLNRRVATRRARLGRAFRGTRSSPLARRARARSRS